MAVGTSTVLNDTRYDIISDALMLLGVNEAGENISDADMQLGVRWLNRMIKQWESKGMFLNTNAYATLFLEYGVSKYILGNEAAGLAHWAEDPVTQTLESDLIVGATSVTVDSTALMTVGDHVGIVDDSSDIQWTTVSSITNATTFVLTVPLLVASASGNLVYSYTTRPSSGAPLKILGANILTQSGEQTSSILLPILSFLDFFQLTNKKQIGQPTNMVYDKKIDTGTVNIWLTPNTASARIELHYERPMFDFTLATSTQDLPPQYLSAIIYGLAVLLAPSYGRSEILTTLLPIAEQMLDEVEQFDQENISLYMSPTQYRY